MRDTHESRGVIGDGEVFGRITGQYERSGVLRTIVQGVGEENGSASGKVREYEVKVEKGQDIEDLPVVDGVEQVEAVVGVGVSAKTLVNRERRRQKRDKKKARQAGMKRDDWRKKVEAEEGKSSLQLSLEAKWRAQNELEVARAKRQLEVLGAKDVEQEKRMQHSRMVKATESNLVAVEKAHNSLKQTGNVPGFVPGTAETVVSGVPTLSTGSISPNSSVSEAEVRKLMKDFEDVKLENKRLTEVNRSYGIEKLKTGVTVAFTADNMSDEFVEKLKECVGGELEMNEEPLDPSTVYCKMAEYEMNGDALDRW